MQELLDQQGADARHRLYPSLVTLGLFVEQTLHRDQACQDAVGRALSQRTALGLSPSSLNSGPYCKARQRLSLGLIETLAQEVAATTQASAPAHWRWRGREVKLIDGTTVSMPDTAANQIAFPQNCHQKPVSDFRRRGLSG